jgi:hypothetical protein
MYIQESLRLSQRLEQAFEEALSSGSIPADLKIYINHLTILIDSACRYS